MYTPRDFCNAEENFWNLINSTILCDVSVERQVEIKGPDASHFIQYICSRDLSNCEIGQCKYVLPPEHPFPTLIDDTYYAYNWLLKKGIYFDDIIVSGQSTCSLLHLALLFKIKKNNGSQPKGTVAISLWTDLSQSGKTMISNANINPLASKLYGNLLRLTPLLVQVGSAEIMLDDSKRFVK